ncbi:transposase [Sorangium sp. So ce341]|uniref:transposase n=1 Tax=Sorangium sp. So ce341 TaxID=3133302 RepID=UPI003F63BDD8
MEAEGCIVQDGGYHTSPACTMQLKTILNRGPEASPFRLRQGRTADGPERPKHPECGSSVVQAVPTHLQWMRAEEAAYDRLPERLYEFVPLWGTLVYFVYAPRRADCSKCGVNVELLPWSNGKSSITTAYAWLLASWAKALSWPKWQGDSRRVGKSYSAQCECRRMGACTHESRWYSLHWRRWIRVEEGAQVPDGCLSGRKKLERWTEWGLHSQLAPFAKAAKTIRKHLDGIDACIASGLTNARSEGMRRREPSRGGPMASTVPQASSPSCSSAAPASCWNPYGRSRAPTKRAGEAKFL